MNEENIFEGLNSSQAEAVRSTDGPCLIVAGAGSGKTRVLTCRIAYLIEKGADPSRILALTFTRKAAGEMKERIAAMVGSRNARRLHMGTFHSVVVKLLRDYAESQGYTRDFTIADTSTSQNAIKAIIKDLALSDKIYKPKAVLSRISMAKTNLVTAEAYARSPKVLQEDSRKGIGSLHQIYTEYSRRLKASSMMDYDDILLNMDILLKDNAQACAELASRFDYILVDEYQDTNFAQYYIIYKLSIPHGNITVVGDDSQSIYAFRGAKIQNIINFRNDFKGCRIFRLEQNYRSTQTIVEAANSLIEKNSSRIPKKCFSMGEKGELIALLSAYTEDDEASQIVSSIIRKISHHKAQYCDFAILYRTNAQSRALETALRKVNIPYRIFSGNAFFERAEIMDMMAFYRLAINPADDEAFKRICNRPSRGISPNTLGALMTAAHEGESPRPLLSTIYDVDLSRYGLKSAAIKSLRAFGDMMRAFCEAASTTDAYALGVKIANETLYYDALKNDLSVEGQSRLANVDELLNGIKSYVDERHTEVYEAYLAEVIAGDGGDLGPKDRPVNRKEAAVQMSDADLSQVELPVVTLAEFVENVSLLSAVDVDDENPNKVTLMTVHSAKGLEFKHVFVSGLEDNLFPSGGFLALPEEIEEERRLMYVAMTRAMVTLTLSYATCRMRNGVRESGSPSPFIFEIAPQFFQNPPKKARKADFSREPSSFASSPTFTPASRPGGSAPLISQEKSQPQASRLKPLSQATSKISGQKVPPHELRSGMRVLHAKFGLGTILSLEADFSKAKVDFDTHGVKTLLLAYAGLEKVD